jgi:hypothetical protein
LERQLQIINGVYGITAGIQGKASLADISR